ncbi:hypothetical protein WJX79_004582 [Trebouxia sp. C0005]
MQAIDLQTDQRLLQLQGVAEQLQTSIAKHSQLTLSQLPLDLRAVLQYAHKIAYTSYAPLGHDPNQPLPPNFRPPSPQEWQLRASQLHQFQAECDQKKAQEQADSRAMPSEANQRASSGVHPQLPSGLKLPPMPKGWKPGMPIPGLDELLSPDGVGLSTVVLPAAKPGAPPRQQSSVSAVQLSSGQFQVVQDQETPAQDMQQAAQPAVRPAPFVPDFVLNPTLEAVEEEYSSSDYSDEEI